MAVTGGWQCVTAAVADEPVRLGRPPIAQVSHESPNEWQSRRPSGSNALRDAVDRTPAATAPADPVTVRYVSNTVTRDGKLVKWRVRDTDPPAEISSSSPSGDLELNAPAKSNLRVADSSRRGMVRQASESAADPFRDPFNDRASFQPPANQDDGADLNPPQDETQLTPPDREETPSRAAEPPEFQPPSAGVAPPPDFAPPATPRTFRSGDSGRGAPPRSLPAAPPRSLETVQSDEPAPPRVAPKNYGADSVVPNSVRSAAYCRRLYNERNCCSDESLCNEHRERVKSHPLSKISLDITPTCNLSTRQGEQGQCGWPFEEAPARVWRDRKGDVVAEGRVTALANLRIDVTGDDGQTVRVPLKQLSEDDICFLAAYCGVPAECRLDDIPLLARNWTPITMTWKASGLCHKPLYFEEVALERYGHTTGPIAQPVVSGAHFFLNIAMLPYKMGIHPPNECMYSLGYYRPGVCAPKMIPPFPLSLRGAAWETGAVLGGVF